MTIRILAALTAFCALFLAPASAQQAPGDLYTVAGVRADETAASPAAARTQAMASVQRSAFDVLARRLLSPAQAQTVVRPDDATLDRLVRGVDVEEQPRTSGTRYLGRFAVRFDPTGVRAYLQEAGLTVSETRGDPVLIVPVLAGASPPTPGPSPSTPAPTDPWRQALEQGGFARESLPLLIAPPAVTGPADWNTAAVTAGSLGATTAIFAIARNTGPTLVADLIEASPTSRTNRGQVTVQVIGGDVGAPDAFRRLATAVNAKLQDEFKMRGGAEPRSRSKMSVSAMYRNQGEWSRIKEGLGAASGVISEIRIEAIARDGALVSFNFSGAPEALAASLRRFGLQLSDSAQGPVLRATTQ